MSGGYIKLSTTSDLEARPAAYVGPGSQTIWGTALAPGLVNGGLRLGTRLTEGAEDRLGSETEVAERFD
ncbi:hypothetical protein V1294_001087 [Bradyrhizobium sp. AZCC 1678]